MRKTGIKDLYRYYYILLYVAYILFVYIPEFRIGFFCTVLTLIVCIQWLGTKVTKTGIWVYSLMSWSIFTIILVDTSMTSYAVCLREIANYILPMLFFFVGEKAEETDKERNFYDTLVLAAMICWIAGLFWYVLEPDYYFLFLRRNGHALSRELYNFDKRFVSFLGSIGTGLIANCGLILSLCKWCDSHNRKYIVYMVCMYAMGLLSMQRSAYVMMLIFSFWIAVRNRILKNRGVILLFFFAIIGFFIFYIADIKYFIDTFDQILHRISEIKIVEMLGSRMDIWEPVFLMGIRLIIGTGIGTCAFGGATPVTDGAIIKILGETGIVGIALWVIILIKTFYSYACIKKINNEVLIPFLLIIAFGLNSIGSNCIVFMETAPIFWFSVGKISNMKLRKRENYV